MTNEIKAVLFDLDGVLVNSAQLIVSAFEHTIRECNFKDDLTLRKSLKGCGLRDTYSHFATGELLDLACQIHTQFQNNNLNLVFNYPDSVNVLNVLKQLGIKIGVVTNRSGNAKTILRHCGLHGLIDQVVDVECVRNCKPDPEGIFIALKHFGCDLRNAVMVGDMPVDIRAGKNARIKTVAVDTSDCTLELIKESPDHIIRELKDLLLVLDIN